MPRNLLKKFALNIILFFALIVSAPAPAFAWDTYLNDPYRTNINEDPITIPPVDSWNERMRTFLKPGFEVVSTPIVHDNVIYLASGSKEFYAYDLLTGDELWEFKATSEVEGTASVLGDKVCFGTSTGVLYCLDKLTGEKIWRYKSKTEILSAPVLIGDKLFFVSADGRIYALSFESGEKLWTFSQFNLETVSTRYYSSPAVLGTRLYQHFSTGALVCLDTVTGRELWTVKAKGDVLRSTMKRRMTPMIDPVNSIVYIINERGAVVGYDAETGELKKKISLLRAFDFIISKDIIYLASKTQLAAVKMADDTVLWSRKFKNGEPISITAAGYYIFVLSNLETTFYDIEYLKSKKGYLEAFTMEKGFPHWSKKFRGFLKGRAVVDSNRIAVVGANGTLNVFGSD
jgi:outer membrane protein assembly factor BamB